MATLSLSFIRSSLAVSNPLFLFAICSAAMGVPSGWRGVSFSGILLAPFFVLLFMDCCGIVYLNTVGFFYQLLSSL